MNLIDTREMELIKAIADKIHKLHSLEETGSPYKNEKSRTSCWEIRREGQKAMEIMPYYFQSPVELQDMLTQVFKEGLNMDFILPVTVAAFKQRKDTAIKDEVSPYIYEF